MTTTLHRDLHDGGCYELTALNVGGVSYLALVLADADGDRAVVTLDREQQRRLIGDVTDLGGLQQTPATLGAAAALAGAVRRNFELLRDLEKTDPAGVDAIVASMATHLRSWKPLALLATTGGGQ